jgi:hypothetical protein
MEDKGLRISEDTHQKLVAYVTENPIFKMSKVADIAISSWLDSDCHAKVISILKYENKKEA